MTKLTKTTKFISSLQVKPNWYLIDATDAVLGKLAVLIADYITGKKKVTFTPNGDTGDHVVIINAEKIHLSGKKLQQKVYYSHSGYPGGMRSRNAETMLSGPRPEHILHNAVKGMLPKNPLGYAQIKKMHLCIGSENPHEAQKPKVIDNALGCWKVAKKS